MTPSPWEMTDAAPRRWFAAAGGKALGPFDADQIEALVGSGQLRADSLVAPVGTSDWRQIRQDPDLSARAGRGAANVAIRRPTSHAQARRANHPPPAHRAPQSASPARNGEPNQSAMLGRFVVAAIGTSVVYGMFDGLRDFIKGVVSEQLTPMLIDPIMLAQQPDLENGVSSALTVAIIFLAIFAVTGRRSARTAGTGGVARSGAAPAKMIGLFRSTTAGTLSAPTTARGALRSDPILFRRAPPPAFQQPRRGV